MSKKIFFNDKYGLTQAVLDGRKTMTRRVFDKDWFDKNWSDGYANFTMTLFEESVIAEYSRYKIGEVVAIAQSYKEVYSAGYPVDSRYDPFRTAYSVGVMENEKGWNNKIFVAAKYMPHHIRITDVRVERLQDISHEDCLTEGIYSRNDFVETKLVDGVVYAFNNSEKNWLTPREAFAALIDKVSGKGTWESNPWCFCYEFELID